MKTNKQGRLNNYLKHYCREHSEVTLHFRPFIFNGIPMLLIRLHGDFSINVSQEGGGDGEGKITSRRIHISKFRFHRMEASGAKRIYFEFHDHTFIGEFSTDNVSFGCKGVMYLVDFP